MRTEHTVVSGSLEIREPRQRRSREAWWSVLSAGVAILEQGGYEAFTIAAVCDRAGVPPRALYARVDSKDALLLAVYEHGIQGVRADHAVFDDHARWLAVPRDELVASLISELAGIFDRHAALLRNVVLISGAHLEVKRRGGRYSAQLGRQVGAVLLLRRAEMTAPDPVQAVSAAFNIVFASLVLRVAYGPDFAVPAQVGEAFPEVLTDMIDQYLFGPRRG